MAKEKYHHGNLKSDLIEKGLTLLNREGYEGFSLRKVAALCGVSQAAPYKHFGSKEELIMAISSQVTTRFTGTIAEAAQQNNCGPKVRLQKLAEQYVLFMTENPEYFKFIFLTNHQRPIKMTDAGFIVPDYHPFHMIEMCAADYYAAAGIDKQSWAVETMGLWSLVHGFTVIMIHNTISYSEDPLKLLCRLLESHLLA